MHTNVSIYKHRGKDTLLKIDVVFLKTAILSREYFVMCVDCYPFRKVVVQSQTLMSGTPRSNRAVSNQNK